MLCISKHACKRYLQRVKHMTTWTDMDIEQARQTLQQIIVKYKHKIISTTDKRQYRLVGGLILVCLKAKGLLLTLIPYNQRYINRLRNKNKHISNHKNNITGVNTYETFNPAFAIAWEKVISKGSSLEGLFLR